MEWLPPSRSGVALPTSTAFQRTRSQKNWLLKTHSEAFLGNLNLPGLISEESARHDESTGFGRARSILAVGEINNMRDARSSRTTAWPVVAMAAGEGGHILQVSAIRTVKWNWAKFSFPVGESESTFHGSWHGDGSPITQIKFATKPKQFDSIRWLIVQKETSTTIFEPELRAKPITRDTSMLGPQTVTIEHIAINPVITLTSESTGGQAHCDFSINLGSEEQAPQLVIIDSSGTWSIWFLDREGHTTPRKNRAVLKKRGSWVPPLSTRPWGVRDLSSKAYNVAWTSRLRSTDAWIRDESPSGDADHAIAGGLRDAFLSGLGTFNDKFDGLAICNSKQLQTLSAADDAWTTWLDFMRRDGADALLSIQSFPDSPAHLLVLTTDAIHLLDVGVADEHKTRPPRILVSCRHYRNARREILKLSVTRLRPVEGEATSLVLLHSTKNNRLDLFSFTIIQDDGTARFYHQLLHLTHIKAPSGADNGGIESLVAIPLQLRPDLKDGTVHGVKPSGAQFYQIFGLTTGLSLVSTIIIHSQESSEVLPCPIKSHDVGWSESRRNRFLRNKMLRQNERAFVIEDASEEHQPNVVRAAEHSMKIQTVQLRFYLSRLVEEINRGFFGEPDREDVADTQGPFFSICSAAQGPLEDSHIPLRPVLGFSKWWQPLNLSRDEEQWDFDLKQLEKNQEIQLFECGNQATRLGLMDLFEKLSIDWSSGLPADGLKATQWRYMELALERMAAEVYLSARGIYMAPQATRDLAAKAAPVVKREMNDEYDLNDLPSSQPGSQQPFHTPLTTPSISRATSEALSDGIRSQPEEEQGQEDPAVARLRMYLPSIKFTPPPKNGPSRVISLWPEQRGVDPSDYEYRPLGKGTDAEAQAAKRRREREAERLRRKAERRAQLGIEMESIAESLSQPLPPPVIQSSPPPPEVRSSQIHTQGFGFASQSQSQSQSRNFGVGGLSQTMSQPLPGEFGTRQVRPKKKVKVKAKRTIGF